MSKPRKNKPHVSVSSKPAETWSFEKLPTWGYFTILAVLCILFYAKVLFGQAWFWEDLIHQEFPHRIFARDMFLSLQFPHWNPYTFGGMPFFSALHTGTLYPFNLLLSFIPASQSVFWYLLELMIIGHVFAAGICMFLFAREIKLSAAASLLASISFMFCGFFVTHIIHSLMLYILVWTPLVMLLLKRTVEQRRLATALWAGLILGATIFAGHPQITFYQFLFLGLYCLYLLYVNTPLTVQQVARVFSPFLIAAGIALVQLLPASELSGQSMRTEWSFAQAAEGSLSPRQLCALMVPKLFGSQTTNPADVPYWLNDSALYRNGKWTYWESTFYTGIAVLVLGLAMFSRLRSEPFVQMAAVAMGGSLFIGLGDHFFLYSILYKHVPGFGSFRFPGRILFVWDLLLPILAGMMFDRIRERKFTTGQFRTLVILAGAAIAFGLFVVSGMARSAWLELGRPEYNQFAKRQALTMLAMLAAAIVVCTLFIYKKINGQAFGTLLVSLVALDLFIFGLGQHVQSQESAATHFAMNSPVATFLKDKGTHELFRANVRDLRQPSYMLLRRNQGMIDKIQMLAGYDPLNLQRKLPPTGLRTQIDLMNVRYAIQVDQQRRNIGLAENPTPLPRARMFFRWRVIESDSAQIAYMQSNEYDCRSELVLDHPIPIHEQTSVNEPQSNTKIVSYRPNRIELSVQTEAEGLLWLSELAYPAWKCRLDGKRVPVLRADYVFRSVAVPPGKHTVVFTFESGPFRVGLALSVLTLLACAKLLYREWAIKKRGTSVGAPRSQGSTPT